MSSCIHLIDDARPGGVLTNLNTLASHSLSGTQLHAVKLVDPRKIHQARHLSAKNIVVHFSISWAKLPYLGALRLLNPGARLLLQEHHYSPEHFAMTPAALSRFKKLYRVAAGLFDHIIAVSQPQAEWYLAMGDQSVSVIPPMANLKPLLEIPPKGKTDRVVVGISGRLNETKGIDLALSLLESPQAQACNFLFAGYGELVPAIVQAELTSTNVRFMGAYEHSREFLEQVDLVMIPSRLDTYGLSALEAAGKPIVVSRTCGLTAQAHRCGIAVNSNSSTALAQALQSLLANNQLAALGQQARAGATHHNQNARQCWASILSEA